MAKKRTVVWIHWVDGPVTDTDEVVVYADSPASAKTAASDKWQMTIGVRWPNCRIEEAEIPSASRRLAVA
jgi:hypothetical protein